MKGIPELLGFKKNKKVRAHSVSETFFMNGTPLLHNTFLCFFLPSSILSVVKIGFWIWSLVKEKTQKTSCLSAFVVNLILTFRFY